MVDNFSLFGFSLFPPFRFSKSLVNVAKILTLHILWPDFCFDCLLRYPAISYNRVRKKGYNFKVITINIAQRAVKLS
jgi:hypothetical protein